MIPVLTSYDKNINQPKLTEQKNPFGYIVPLPQVDIVPPPPPRVDRNKN